MKKVIGILFFYLVSFSCAGSSLCVWTPLLAHPNNSRVTLWGLQLLTCMWVPLSKASVVYLAVGHSKHFNPSIVFHRALLMEFWEMWWFVWEWPPQEMEYLISSWLDPFWTIRRCRLIGWGVSWRGLWGFKRLASFPVSLLVNQDVGFSHSCCHTFVLPSWLLTLLAFETVAQLGTFFYK